MPSKFNIALIGITAFSVVNDVRTVISARKYMQSGNETIATLTQANDMLIDECMAQEHKIEYLMHKLNEHGVPMDEFDIIALNYRK